MIVQGKLLKLSGLRRIVRQKQKGMNMMERDGLQE